MNPVGSVSRRELIGGIGTAGIGLFAGCTERVWSTAEHSPPNQIQLTVKTPPTDDDVSATTIGSQLVDNLSRAGIDARHEPIAETELYRDVLMNHDFEIFIAHHPGLSDFDTLRELLHSTYRSERGWQNPFGFVNNGIDTLLHEQRTQEDYERVSTMTGLFDQLLAVAPYSALVYPDRLGAARAEIAASRPPISPAEYADLFVRSTATESSALRVGIFDRTVTEHLNPISVTLGDSSALLGLLYDPLVRVVDGEHVPWLASDIEWDRTDTNSAADPTLRATITLREGITWHDQTPIEAPDVEFTIRFLRDTALDGADSPIPAPRYRSQCSLIEQVDRIDERTVRLSFGESSRAVAEHALTVPLLPEQVWSDRSELVGNLLTEALVWDNQEPIGSGLFSVTERSSGSSLRLEPYREHVLWQESDVEIPALASQYEALEFQVAANREAALESILEGDLELIAGALPAAAADELSTTDDVNLLERATHSFYLIGYNTRHPELGNPQFRHIVSQLVDRHHVAAEFFDGRATPAAAHNELAGVAGDSWKTPVTSGIEPFPGSDGEIDDEQVRSMFRDAGYRYDDGSLLE